MRASLAGGVPLGEALNEGRGSFTRLQRRITLAERSYKDAFQELQRLQVSRQPLPEPVDPPVASEPEDPSLSTGQPKPATYETAQMASFLTGLTSPGHPNGHQPPELPIQSSD